MSGTEQFINRCREFGVAAPGLLLQRRTDDLALRKALFGRIIKQQYLGDNALQRATRCPAHRFAQGEVTQPGKPGAEFQQKSPAGAFIPLHRGGEQYPREACHQLCQQRAGDCRSLIDDQPVSTHVRCQQRVRGHKVIAVATEAGDNLCRRSGGSRHNGVACNTA